MHSMVFRLDGKEMAWSALKVVFAHDSVYDTPESRKKKRLV